MINAAGGGPINPFLSTDALLRMLGYPIVSGGLGSFRTPLILRNKGATQSITGTLVETTLDTFNIPAGIFDANCLLSVYTLWSFTNSANNKILKTTLGGTAFMSSTATTTATGSMDCRIGFNNSLSSQSAFASSASYGLATNSLNAGTIDGSAQQTLAITATLANTGETITLRRVLAVLFPGV